MSRPHIDSDHGAAKLAFRAFLRALERGEGPRNAALAAMAAGAYVSPEWLRASYCPVLSTIATLESRGDHAGALAYKNHNLAAWQQERAALSICEARRSWAETTSLDDDARQVAEQREVDRLKQRAAFINARGAALFEGWLAEQRERFRAEAGAEFDALHPPVVAMPAGVVSIAPTATAKPKRQQPKNEPPSAA